MKFNMDQEIRKVNKLALNSFDDDKLSALLNQFRRPGKMLPKATICLAKRLHSSFQITTDRKSVRFSEARCLQIYR